MVHPQVHKEDGDSGFTCAFMTLLLSLESFVGVLFASFCGAVIVGKVTRAKSTASTRFSHRIVLRFASGVLYTDDDDDRCDIGVERPVTEYEKRRTRFPCPVLEFRVINALYNNPNGEIMNTKLSVVGSTLADTELPSTTPLESSRSPLTSMARGPRASMMFKGATGFIRKQMTRSDDESSDGGRVLQRTSSGCSDHGLSKIFGGRKSPAEMTNLTRDSGVSGDHKEHAKRPGRMKRLSLMGHEKIESVLLKKRLLRPTRSHSGSDDGLKSRGQESKSKFKKKVYVDEDPTGGLVPKKVFSTLKIECDTHPFFKRVWTIRHVLNADSPLVSPKARRMIKESRGMWPAEACNYQFIRENVHFQQLIVSLSGTTCVQGCNVYGLHVYEYPNLHVGYAFAPVLEMGPDGKLKVDLERTDNIQVQRGGGEEPLNYYEERITEVATQKDSKTAAMMKRNSMNICDHKLIASIMESSEGEDATSEQVVNIEDLQMSSSSEQEESTQKEGQKPVNVLACPIGSLCDRSSARRLSFS
jgi:hypothetical protein